MLKRINPKLVLVLLIGIWAAVIAYRILSHDEPQRAPLTYRKGQSVAVATKAAPARAGGRRDLTLKLDLLDQKPPTPGGKLKNLFLPLRYDPPKPPAPPPTLPPTPPPTLPPPPPPPTPEEIAAEQARRDLSEFRYLGYLNRAGNEQAFLSRKGTLFTPKNGEVIAGFFLIKTLNSNFVIIQETGTQIEIMLPLTGG
jgi:hypothetical protein